MMNGDADGIQVLEFDDSSDNHLRAVETIFRICGQPDIDQFDKAEVERVGSSVTFLRHWRDYTYEPRAVNFSHETEKSHCGYGTNEITLPLFSAAVVPKDTHSTATTFSSQNSSKDFLLYCGGPIWALDWCPQVRPDSCDNVCHEFLAVAAHPPGSSYHKLNTPLNGRGAIQIWCSLNVKSTKGMEELSMEKFHPKGRGRPKNIHNGSEDALPKRPLGRPKKVHGGSEDTLALHKRPVGRPRNESTDRSRDQEVPKRRGRPRKKPVSEIMNEIGDSFSGSGINKLPKSMKQRSSQNNMLPESSNVLSTPDALNIVNNYECNQALVQCFTEYSPHPIALDEVSVEQSTSVKSVEQTPSMLLTSDLVSADEFMPIRAVNFSDDDSEVSLLLKRARDRSTQPIKTYVRRHKASKTMLYEETVKASTNTPEQCMTHFDNADPAERYNLEELPPSSSVVQDVKHLSLDLGPLALCNTISSEQVESFSTDLSIPQELAFPRLIFCLAHNGKVVWDVKWRPIAHPSHCKLRMGYLAVLLGNGSLEVWDVPLPNVVCDLFSSYCTEGTDPRFIKLEPAFKCSKLKFGGMQSIPLTVEWSASFPHDLLLAGCHDGTVAVWKFFEGNPCEETRPLLFFRADTDFIRAVSWAPAEKDGEDAKVIVTAGHNGLKFWDIRDPFHPLWTLPLLRIYSLDWMPYPRCIVISSDDGSLKLLSISQTSDDTCVTGKPFSGSKSQGLHTYNCSSSAIWSIHISRVTGMAAYCSQDGTVVRFQLTTKMVEKDHSRNRVPHFLFWSLTGNDSVLTVNTPPSNTPADMKKPNYGLQSMRALVGLFNQPQTNYPQLTEPLSEDRTLALCSVDDSGQVNHLLTASAGPVSKIGDEKNQRDKLAMVCHVAEGKNTNEENPVKPAVKPSGPPPKLLAMHRVRWNMNKGSERWLSSGGAAGIVRCQELVFTDVDKMYYRNK